MTKKTDSQQAPEESFQMAPADGARSGGMLRRTVIGLLGALVVLTVLYAVNAPFRNAVTSSIDSTARRISKWSEEAPDPDLVALDKASELIWQDKWDEANAIYEQLHDKYPDNAFVWYGLGLCRHNLGDYDGAIEANLQASGKSHSYAATAMYYLATEYALTDRPDEAIETLNKALHQGYRELERIRTDEALDSIRDDPRFSIPDGPEYLAFTCADGTVINYALVLPRDFDESKTYPALLGFTGSGQQKSTVDYALDTFWGLQAHYQGWIVVSPVALGPKGYFHCDDFLKLAELLDDVRKRCRIEGDAFHVAGFSNGGTSALNIATAFPEEFQTLTAFPCYEIYEYAEAHLESLKGLKVNLYYGTNDGGPSMEATESLHRRLLDLGIDSTLTVLEDEGHVPISLMGDRFMTFLETQRRPES